MLEQREDVRRLSQRHQRRFQGFGPPFEGFQHPAFMSVLWDLANRPLSVFVIVSIGRGVRDDALSATWGSIRGRIVVHSIHMEGIH